MCDVSQREKWVIFKSPEISNIIKNIETVIKNIGAINQTSQEFQ